MATRQKKNTDEAKAPHQALYRTYRPHTFDDVEGQEHFLHHNHQTLTTILFVLGRDWQAEYQ
jgi:replication-associated recombination protein RarA